MAHDLIQALTVDSKAKEHYGYSQGILRYKGRIYMRNQLELRPKVIEASHGSSLGGHSGMIGTYNMVKSLFFCQE